MFFYLRKLIPLSGDFLFKIKVYHLSKVLQDQTRHLRTDRKEYWRFYKESVENIENSH